MHPYTCPTLVYMCNMNPWYCCSFSILWYKKFDNSFPINFFNLKKKLQFQKKTFQKFTQFFFVKKKTNKICWGKKKALAATKPYNHSFHLLESFQHHLWVSTMFPKAYKMFVRVSFLFHLWGEPQWADPVSIWLPNPNPNTRLLLLPRDPSWED